MGLPSYVGSCKERPHAIGSERLGAKRKQEKQAERMLDKSAKCFKPAEVGDNVVVNVPSVDQGRGDCLSQCYGCRY